MHMECTEDVVYLTHLNGTGYIFNIEDYMKVRRKYRIVGSLVGTCGARGWSASSFSLPAELGKHETQLLLEKGFAVLLSKSESLLRQPTDEELRLYRDEEERSIRGQEEHLVEGRVKQSMNHIDKIVYGKRKKLMRSGIPEKDIKLSAEDVIREIRENTTFDRENALTEIHCEHPKSHVGIPVTKEFHQPLKYRVFKDLWERGKYITCGESFGGDFLVYPGDPIMFHASHIVIVLEEPRIDPLMLVAKVRLAVTVNKLCVFAYAGINNKVSYQTVKWKGNRGRKND